MEPIRISDIKKFLHDFSERKVQKFDLTDDGFIDSTELGALLSHFVSDGVSKLTKESSETKENKVGLDTFEKSKAGTKKQVDEDVDADNEAKEQVIEDIDADNEAEEQVIAKQSNFKDSNVLANAQYNLEKLVNGGFTSYDGDNHFGLTQQALEEQKSKATELGVDVKNIESMQDNLNELLEHNHQTGTIVHNEEKEKVVHLKNGDVRITQSIGVGANSAIANNDAKDLNSDEIADGAETETSNDEDLAKNISNMGVSYKLGISAENKKGYNSYTNVNIDASTENMDIKFSTTHTKTFPDASQLKTTFAARETFVSNKNNGSGGFALDYKKSDLSTGMYGYYEHIKVENQQNWQGQADAYLKYKDNVSLTAKYGANDYFSNFDAEIDLNGAKEVNKNLKLAGGVSFGGGYIKFDPKQIPGIVNDRFSTAFADVKGGLHFAAEDITASVNGIASYHFLKGSLETNEPVCTHRLSGAVGGAFTKGKYGISALVNVVKENLTNSDPASVSANVTFSYRDFIKKGITPYVSYTFDNSTNAIQVPYEHTVAAGLKVSF